MTDILKFGKNSEIGLVWYGLVESVWLTFGHIPWALLLDVQNVILTIQDEFKTLSQKARNWRHLSDSAQGEVFLHPSWNNFRAAIIAAAAETVPNSEIWRWRCMSVVSGGSEVADGEKMFWKVEKMKADDNKNTHVLLFS